MIEPSDNQILRTALRIIRAHLLTHPEDPGYAAKIAHTAIMATSIQENCKFQRERARALFHRTTTGVVLTGVLP